jgi:hypothetical protein
LHVLEPVDVENTLISNELLLLPLLIADVGGAPVDPVAPLERLALLELGVAGGETLLACPVVGEFGGDGDDDDDGCDGCDGWMLEGVGLGLKDIGVPDWLDRSSELGRFDGEELFTGSEPLESELWSVDDEAAAELVPMDELEGWFSVELLL